MSGAYDAQKNMREAFKKLMDEFEGLEQRHAMVCEELDEERIKARELQRRLDTLPRPKPIVGTATAFAVALVIAGLVGAYLSGGYAL